MNTSGQKYLRTIRGFTSADDDANETRVRVDVYAVLLAFDVTDPGIQHAVKKLLCAGLRGKGDVLQDLREARDAIDRALQLAGPLRVAPASPSRVPEAPPVPPPFPRPSQAPWTGKLPPAVTVTRVVLSGAINALNLDALADQPDHVIADRLFEALAGGEVRPWPAPPPRAAVTITRT